MTVIDLTTQTWALIHENLSVFRNNLTAYENLVHGSKQSVFQNTCWKMFYCLTLFISAKLLLDLFKKFNPGPRYYLTRSVCRFPAKTWRKKTRTWRKNSFLCSLKSSVYLFIVAQCTKWAILNYLIDLRTFEFFLN